MKTERKIVIEEKDYSELLEELTYLMGDALTGLDPNSGDGVEFKQKHPAAYKLFNLLQAEVVKDQSTYNYERIKG